MNAIKDAASNAPSLPLPGKLGEMLSNNWQVVAITLLVGISISFIVGMFFYYVIKRGQIGKKNVFKIEGIETPVPGNQVTKLSGNNMPSNPDELSMSFWIYVESFDRTGKLYRHVLHRGKSSATNAQTVGPLVYIDKDSNKLHITFRPKNQASPLDRPSDVSTATKPYMPNGTTPDDKLKQFEYIKGKGGITIDYIPTQRWVHVLVTVNRKTNTMKAYVDGEDVKTMNGSKRGSITVTPAVRGKDKVLYAFNLPNTDILGEGDFYVGGRASSTTGIGFDGLVSNLKFFDYEMTKTEVYNEYRRGPMDNIMSKLGLPAYGVRTPIYPLTAKSS